MAKPDICHSNALKDPDPTMPPILPSTQRVIDSIVATGADQVPSSMILHLVIAFHNLSEKHMSPLQFVWQLGEFIRIAIQYHRIECAMMFAEWFVGGLKGSGPLSSSYVAFSFEHRSFKTSELPSVLRLRGANKLLFLALFAPMCPDPGASLDLFQLVVSAIRQHLLPGMVNARWHAHMYLDPFWISSVVLVYGCLFYVHDDVAFRRDDFTARYSVMRRDHITASVKWLLGPKLPLPIQIRLGPAAVNGLQMMSKEVRPLLFRAILHSQSRDDLLAFRHDMQVNVQWNHQTMQGECQAMLVELDSHIEMHAPPMDAVSHLQAQIMDNLVEQLMRHDAATRSEISDPFNLAGIVMDYVHRDDSVVAEGAKLPVYKKYENDHLHRRVGTMHTVLAKEQVAETGKVVGEATSSSDARVISTPSRPRDEPLSVGDDVTDDQQPSIAAKRARLNVHRQ